MHRGVYLAGTFPSNGQSDSNGINDNNEGKFKNGLDLMKKGDYQGAILVFNDYLHHHPTEVKAKVNKGICLYNLQRDIEAKKILEEVTKNVTTKNVPENAEKQDYIDYYKGLAYFYLKEYSESLAFFLSSSHDLCFIMIGQTCLEISEYLEDLRRRVYHGIKVKGNINKEIKNTGEVIKKIGQSSNNVQNDSNIIIHSLEKLTSKAKSLSIEYLEKGIRVLDKKIGEKGLWETDNLSELYYNRGVALSNLGKYEEAITAFDEAIGESDSYALALNNKGNTCVKMENFEDAIEAYTKAIKISEKKYSIAYNNRGQVYFNLKNYKKALEDFEEAIKSNPLNYNAWTNKGAVFFYQKEYGKAKEAFEKALDLNPDYALANVYLAKLFFYLGNPTLAFETINKALDLDVRNADAWRLKGQLLLEDNYEEAVKSFDNAVQYSKGDVSLVLWKAYARYLKVLNTKSQTSSSSNQEESSNQVGSSNQEEKPKFPWFSEIKKKINSLLPKSNNSQSSNESPNKKEDKKKINSLLPKSNNSQSSSGSPDKKEDEGSKSKNEYYSIIRELEMYSSISSGRKDTKKHIILEKWDDFSFWVRKNIELLFLPFIRYFLINHILFFILILIFILLGLIYLIIADLIQITVVFEPSIHLTTAFKPLIGRLLIIVIVLMISFIILKAVVPSNTYLQSINSALEKHETNNVNSYVLCLLGCLYYEVGDYFEAKNKLEECIKYGSKDVKKSATPVLDYKSATPVLDYISANRIRSTWWTWWIASPTYRWAKRVIFVFSSLWFISLLLFHPFIYPILFKFIYFRQFKIFFSEANVFSNMTDNNEIFTNFDPSIVDKSLYYALILIPLFILFSPHILKFGLKAPYVEIEMKSPKDFEFILHPCLMDDVVRKIDDIT